MLGSCATFSATTPLGRTEKGGAHRGGAKVKNNGAVAVVQKMALIRAISTPFPNKILHRNLNKLQLLSRLKVPKFELREGDCGQTIKHSAGTGTYTLYSSKKTKAENFWLNAAQLGTFFP